MDTIQFLSISWIASKLRRQRRAESTVATNRSTGFSANRSSSTIAATSSTYVTEFDERAGTPGLHTVRGTVKAEQRETLLPPDLFNRFRNDAFWRNPQSIPSGLQMV